MRLLRSLRVQELARGMKPLKRMLQFLEQKTTISDKERGQSRSWLSRHRWPHSGQ